MSRLVLTSPFDWDVQSSSDRKVEEDGSSAATTNIMVDTRVVRRRTFDASLTKNAAEFNSSADQPGCILFDRRLIIGDIFANANPTIRANAENAKQKRAAARGTRTVSTPPPVKGRCHVSVQTVDDIETVESCAQTIL